MLETAGPDPVRALFVFLHLLKRQPQSVPERALAHTEHEPPHADPAANMYVSGITLPQYHCDLFLSSLPLALPRLQFDAGFITVRELHTGSLTAILALSAPRNGANLPTLLVGWQ